MKSKTLFALIVPFVFILCLVIIPACADENPVEPDKRTELLKYDPDRVLDVFEDPSLKIIMLDYFVPRKMLQLRRGGNFTKITLEDLESLKSFDLQDKKIKSLQGIQYCKNLLSLNISSNPLA